jgi:hypothetical protein
LSGVRVTQHAQQVSLPRHQQAKPVPIRGGA